MCGDNALTREEEREEKEGERRKSAKGEAQCVIGRPSLSLGRKGRRAEALAGKLQSRARRGEARRPPAEERGARGRGETRKKRESVRK